jgi:hypothetical protein
LASHAGLNALRQFWRSHACSNRREAVLQMDWRKSINASPILQHIEVRVAESFAGLSAGERRVWDALFEKQSDAVPFQSLAWN